MKKHSDSSYGEIKKRLQQQLGETSDEEDQPVPKQQPKAPFRFLLRAESLKRRIIMTCSDWSDSRGHYCELLMNTYFKTINGFEWIILSR